MKQKYGAEALQLSIPKAPVSESGDGVGTLQFRIHEAPVFDLNDENVGLGLFGD